jgi:hypothetical protein
MNKISAARKINAKIIQSFHNCVPKFVSLTIPFNEAPYSPVNKAFEAWHQLFKVGLASNNSCPIRCLLSLKASGSGTILLFQRIDPGFAATDQTGTAAYSPPAALHPEWML